MTIHDVQARLEALTRRVRVRSKAVPRPRLSPGWARAAKLVRLLEERERAARRPDLEAAAIAAASASGVEAAWARAAALYLKIHALRLLDIEEEKQAAKDRHLERAAAHARSVIAWDIAIRLCRRYERPSSASDAGPLAAGAGSGWPSRGEERAARELLASGAHAIEVARVTGLSLPVVEAIEKGRTFARRLRRTPPPEA